jgi:uncharacterized membrane protein YebE (DUF533 family)
MLLTTKRSGMIWRLGNALRPEPGQDGAVVGRRDQEARRMFNNRDLLGAMLGSGMGGRNPRMSGLGGGGGLGGLGGLLGGSGGGLGGMGGLGGGGGMLGGGMRRGGGLQGGLIGMLGGIAMSALARRMQGGGQGSHDRGLAEAPAERPVATSASPGFGGATQGRDAGGTADAQSAMDEERAQLLVRVMVAAANADMRIDDQERARILGKLDESGADPAARQFVEREMRAPMSIDEIAREVKGPDVAAQAYAAALAAIDVDKAMERRFLASLAQRLGLDAEIVGEIHDQLGQPRPA